MFRAKIWIALLASAQFSLQSLNPTKFLNRNCFPSDNITQSLDWDYNFYCNIQLKLIWNVCTRKEKVSQKDVLYKRTPQKIFELISNGSSAESEVPKFGSAIRRFCLDKSRF